MSLLLRQWKDFVIFPRDPDRIRSVEQRCDLSLESSGAFVVRRDLVVRAGDEFEAMCIDDFGNVMIWTKANVWVVRRLHGMEKLLFLPRYPPGEGSGG